jgi:hypothetical protein
MGIWSGAVATALNAMSKAKKVKRQREDGDEVSAGHKKGRSVASAEPQVYSRLLSASLLWCFRVALVLLPSLRCRVALLLLLALRYIPSFFVNHSLLWWF